MSDWIAIRVVATRGSAPREAGAVMRVWPDRQDGTIGGGALEWEATRQARQILADGTGRTRRTITLGPGLGQCCGGTVTLDFEPGGEEDRPAAPPFWIWGAGHVGRAIAAVVAPLGDRQVVLVDVSADRMPDPVPAGVAPMVATDPVRAVDHAPPEADHVILTYSHDLDLALCDALLRHGFGSCGLIGSRTKWARFRSRLAAMGHSDATIARIHCPIGDPALGKHPQAIAVGVAAALLSPTGLAVARDAG